MNVIAPVFIMTVFMIAVTAATIISPDLSMGCHILGTEVNGDGSVEYLMLGSCY